MSTRTHSHTTAVAVAVCVTFLLCKINNTISHSLIWVHLCPTECSVMSFLTPTGNAHCLQKNSCLNCSINFGLFFGLVFASAKPPKWKWKWKWKQQNASPDSLSIGFHCDKWVRTASRTFDIRLTPLEQAIRRKGRVIEQGPAPSDQSNAQNRTMHHTRSLSSLNVQLTYSSSSLSGELLFEINDVIWNILLVE